MSDTEDCPKREHIDKSSPSEVVEGACGRDFGLRPGTPFSENDDNVSMEVRFSEGSSHHASDLSSLSYQNLLDDEGNSTTLSRRDSEDSVDSYLQDYNEDIQKLSDIGDKSYSDKISERISVQVSAQEGLKVESNLAKSTQSIQSDPGPNVQPPIDFSSKPLKSNSVHPSINVQDSFRKHELLVNMREQQRSHSLPPGDNTSDVQKKRNSLEIRNNIPVSGEVKNYEKDFHIENPAFISHGAKPKIRKQSPGLACRVEDKDSGDNLSQSANQEALNMDSNATQIINDLIQVSKANAAALNASKKSQNKESKEINIIENVPLPEIPRHSSQNGQVLTGVVPPADIVNEYEYVKYSRIQEGNAYVGMRLAYSSSESDSQCQRSADGVDELRDNMRTEIIDLDSHGGQSPDSNLVHTNITDDMLTEIPLNGPEGLLGDDGKEFTLSPENTECDSVEIESVVSDGEGDAAGMPNVEDGLSSSQPSDAEETRSEHNTPKKIIQKKQQEELERKLYGEEGATLRPKEMDAEAIMDDLKMKREALDHAISEIKSAIQKSKGVSLEAPYNADAEEDPIWVKRDEKGTSPRCDSGNEGTNGKSNGDARKPADVRRAEEERGRAMSTEEGGQLGPVTRQDGRQSHTPKGYDSDDEDDVPQYTRRNKGKRYSQLPKDDASECYTNKIYGIGPQLISDSDGSLSHQRLDSVSMYGDSNSFTFTQDSHSERRTSESIPSSDDYGSDPELAEKRSYLPRREGDFDTDEETDQLLEKQYQGNQYMDIPELAQPPVNRAAQAEKRKSRAKEARINDPENPSVLIEGVLFRARYLGSTQLISEGQPSKAMRMMQAQEAVGRIKQTTGQKEAGSGSATDSDLDLAPEGENQPSTDVDLFVSTEKIMVLNTDLQEIMMDHSLRTISYIADIGDILVIMARRRLIGSPGDTDSMRRRKQAKIICHVFESDEAQLIAQSIGQAFQVAYMEFLKANGIEDPGLMKEIDYQEVLNQQQIYGEELTMFSNKENQKEVIVPKCKGEQLGVVIVESGWGSMVPTVVLANMSPTGPAARCGQLNIGDQIISVNGISLVGLPLSSCQTNIKGTKHQTVVKLTVVPCPPVVEVLIKRPDVKYQLGFSVQNGVICSLLRGGIAERGGVRVGHRIIEINNQSVVAVPHEKIVALLANSVGEIHMKTMPTSIFRLLTGQETPHYL